MENAFQSCAHCGTLNFKRNKICSYCKFRLPDLNEKIGKIKTRNSLIIGTVLIALGALLVAALL